MPSIENVNIQDEIKKRKTELQNKRRQLFVSQLIYVKLMKIDGKGNNSSNVEKRTTSS